MKKKIKKVQKNMSKVLIINITTQKNGCFLNVLTSIHFTLYKLQKSKILFI